MRRLTVALAILLTAGVAEAQQAVPIHTHTISLNSTMGAADILPSRVRSFLGFQNDDASVVIYCTVDGTTAAVNSGIRIPAAAASHIVFDAKVPIGAVKCVASTHGTKLLLQEGQ